MLHDPFQCWQTSSFAVITMLHRCTALLLTMLAAVLGKIYILYATWQATGGGPLICRNGTAL